MIPVFHEVFSSILYISLLIFRKANIHVEWIRIYLQFDSLYCKMQTLRVAKHCLQVTDFIYSKT